MVKFIDSSVEPRLNWQDAVEALRIGHLHRRLSTSDMLTPIAGGEILARSAAIEGIGSGIKSVTIMPDNGRRKPPVATVQGLFTLFDERDGSPLCIIDGAFLTKWKTVADSLLGSSFLAVKEPKILTIVGTGVVARALLEGYCAFYPSITEIRVWGRRQTAAQDVAELSPVAQAYSTLEDAVKGADIVTSAVASRDPVIRGAWVDGGTHVDLVGAHGPDMREADDELIRKARLFVDSRDTTIQHIGECILPIRAGVITAADVFADLYDLVKSGVPRDMPGDMPAVPTVYKNGGGAHLDLMIANYILDSM